MHTGGASTGHYSGEAAAVASEVAHRTGSGTGRTDGPVSGGLRHRIRVVVGQIRAIIGVLSAFPLAAAAVVLGLLTWNRRRGLNLFTSTWPGLVVKAGGVRLNVVGAQNLTAQRPAIFLYNHRSRFDPFVASALMGDNWIKVAKKELARDPIVGTILKCVDAAFLDRDDTAASVNTLREIEERTKKGISVLIAPEGSRQDGAGVGSFKKGAFRMAMAAGVPIVPIVIRNVADVAPRESFTITPGTVDIAVLPPISVDGWTPDSLPEHIAQIRQLYIDTLADWPQAVGKTP
ncbi:1-acyl-sn-glycerol-3-phosphate acyltransferase [Mycobacterium szulgai]|nr:1-acyl-sn-glycerol-3-phosphate acyltransferase [Mycobacterium szulgai]